jgi:hypothetical protein
MLADEAKILGAVSGSAHGSFRSAAWLVKILFSGPGPYPIMRG